MEWKKAYWQRKLNVIKNIIVVLWLCWLVIARVYCASFWRSFRSRYGNTLCYASTDIKLSKEKSLSTFFLFLFFLFSLSLIQSCKINFLYEFCYVFHIVVQNFQAKTFKREIFYNEKNQTYFNVKLLISLRNSNAE